MILLIPHSLLILFNKVSTSAFHFGDIAQILNLLIVSLCSSNKLVLISNTHQ